MKFASICLVCAYATVFEMVPDQSARVTILFDADMDPTLFYQTTNNTITQLPALTKVFQDAGVRLAVKFGMTWMNSPVSTCLYRTNYGSDAVTYTDLLESMLESYPLASSDLHRTWYSIAYDAQATNNDDERRVIVLFSDAAGSFGEYTGSIDSCVTNALSPDFFASYLEDNRVGLLYVGVAAAVSTADDLKAEIQTTLAETGLTDVLVDNQSNQYPFDTVEDFLAQLLSPQWTATTSTTLDPKTAAIKKCISETLQCSN